MQKISDDLLSYFEGDEMAASVWLKKYALKDGDDNVVENTPDDMHRRMAKYFAEVEESYEFKEKEGLKFKLSEYGYNREPLTEDKIYNLFKKFKYVVPGGSVMSGLGSKLPVSLSNCFVVDGPNDSIDDIFRVCNEQSQLFKRRGGNGFDISKLRPNGARVNNSAKFSTGAVSFMDLFSNVTNTIAQSGRRGALMISMHVEHPDAKEFIEKKQDLTKVTGANISLQISDKFMEAVLNNEDFIQRWPIDAKFEYDENSKYDELCETKDANGNTVYYKRIKAKELWDTLIHCAWNTAEPGIIFKTRHYNYSPDGVYEQFRGSSTNPCLTGDSFIKTKNGDIPIKDVVELVNNGDIIEVLTFNEETKELEYEEVESGSLTKKNANIIEIECEDGTTLKLTPDHKVFTENRGWVEAANLTDSDVLLSVN